MTDTSITAERNIVADALEFAVHPAVPAGTARMVCELVDEITKLEDTLLALSAERDKLREVLLNLYDLCTVGATWNAFHNGVTDATGTVDEGNVRACEYIDAAAKLLSESAK